MRRPSSPAIEPTTRTIGEVSSLTDYDVHLFNEGSHLHLYEKLGAHRRGREESGYNFTVWAPNARQVSVIGDFNAWKPGSDPLRPVADSGIWEGIVPSAQKGARYKFRIRSHQRGMELDKADPFAFLQEKAPSTGSVVWDLDYEWNDREWMEGRGPRAAREAPVAIYEVHLGSWRRVPEEGNRFLTYRELAPLLADHARDMGFTHVELLPVMEHAFYGSWGYLTTGPFAPASRQGTPQDLMFLIDHLHQAGIGVFLDWVPSHFPTDPHGLGLFDGTHLYEHEDPRQGFHPDWNSYIFNYGRHEVRSFLLSNAFFWLDKYHADGLRVDAVASMLYLDYSRKSGEWVPNRFGGNENLEAVSFLRRLNEETYGAFPGIQMFAEESTAWPAVSRPTYVGGLGFGYKWDMGWMHDTLEYMRHDPVHRRYHHNRLTFRAVYAFSENYLLPLSHDEVVHGKGSLLSKMPGDDWQRLANLRLLLGYQFASPGKKLLFMGGEFGQWREWDHESSLDWHLLSQPAHAGLQRWVRDLVSNYRAEPALHVRDCEPHGFEWIDCNDADQSVLSFLRWDADGTAPVLVAANFTPIPRHNYRVGVPRLGVWREILNSDAKDYGGSGVGNLGGTVALPASSHGRPQSVNLSLPPLGLVILRHEGNPT